MKKIIFIFLMTCSLMAGAVVERPTSPTTFTGLSSDTKPTANIGAGSLFYETDTSVVFTYKGASWIADNESTTQDWHALVGEGLVPGHGYISKFGVNKDIDGGQTEAIWGHSTLFYYLTAASTLNVTSLSAADTSAGTGGRTLFLQGLDAAWLPISETLTLNGQTIVTTTNQYIRINRANIVTVGSGGVNAGEIHFFTGTATAGAPDNDTLVYATISEDHGQTQQAMYSVPSNHTAYLMNGFMVTDKEVVGEMWVRDGMNLGSWRITLAFKTSGEFERRWVIPQKIPSGYDIRVTATATNANTYVAAGYELLLIKEGF